MWDVRLMSGKCWAEILVYVGYCLLELYNQIVSICFVLTIFFSIFVDLFMLLYFKFEFIYCIYLYIYIRLTTLYQHTYDVSVYTSLLALYSSLDERNKPTNIHRERERERKKRNSFQKRRAKNTKKLSCGEK